MQAPVCMEMLQNHRFCFSTILFAGFFRWVKSLLIDEGWLELNTTNPEFSLPFFSAICQYLVSDYVLQGQSLYIFIKGIILHSWNIFIAISALSVQK